MAYLGINNKAREATGFYIGINGVAARVIKGYVGDESGIARLWYELINDPIIPDPGPDVPPVNPDVPSGNYPILHQGWHLELDSVSAITKITFVDSYTSIGSPDMAWSVAEDLTDAVMAYRYGTEIIIAGNGSGRIQAPHSSWGLFKGFKNLVAIEGLTLLDTSNVADMANMFYGCESLVSIDVSNWNTSKVIYMNDMFHDCQSLPLLDLSSFDTRKVTNMGRMFWNCYRLKLIYAGEGWQTAQANVSNMFLYCGCSSVTYK